MTKQLKDLICASINSSKRLFIPVRPRVGLISKTARQASVYVRNLSCLVDNLVFACNFGLTGEICRIGVLIGRTIFSLVKIYRISLLVG